MVTPFLARVLTHSPPNPIPETNQYNIVRSTTTELRDVWTAPYEGDPLGCAHGDQAEHHRLL
jgi:hypothetical protein